MEFSPLIDGASAGIVLGGTALATVLRAGAADLKVTAQALGGLLRPPFRGDVAKGELAGQVTAILRDGLLRADPRPTGDAEFDEATGALIHTRSLGALVERHKAHRHRRMAHAHTAVRTLAQAAELGPVFGMVGTLVSLSRLPSNGLEQGAFGGVIAMAVLTTLYGLLVANLVLAPLARLVERHAQNEEQARQEVIDWLAAQIAPAIPVHRPHAVRDRVPA